MTEKLTKCPIHDEPPIEKFGKLYCRMSGWNINVCDDYTNNR